MILGEHQRKSLIKKGKDWYIHIVVEFTPMPIDGTAVMGIDLGVNNIATTSTGMRIEGKDRQDFK
jgi:transposase